MLKRFCHIVPLSRTSLRRSTLPAMRLFSKRIDVDGVLNSLNDEQKQAVDLKLQAMLADMQMMKDRIMDLEKNKAETTEKENGKQHKFQKSPVNRQVLSENELELKSILTTIVELFQSHGCDVTYGGWKTEEEAKKELRDHKEKVTRGLLTEAELCRVAILFAPTASLQDCAIDSGWSDQYMLLAERFDAVCAELKSERPWDGDCGGGDGQRKLGDACVNELFNMLKAFDQDGDNMLQYGEFRDMASKLGLPPHRTTRLKEKYFPTRDEDLTLDVFTELFNEMASDGDGSNPTLSHADYMRMAEGLELQNRWIWATEKRYYKNRKHLVMGDEYFKLIQEMNDELVEQQKYALV